MWTIAAEIVHVRPQKANTPTPGSEMFLVVNCKPIRGQFVSYWPIRGHFDVIASHKSAAVTKSCNYRHFQVLFWARTIWCPVHCNNCTTHRPPLTQKFLILNISKTNIWTFYNLVHVNYFDTKSSVLCVLSVLGYKIRKALRRIKVCRVNIVQHNLTQTGNMYFLVWIFGLGFVRNSTGSVIHYTGWFIWFSFRKREVVSIFRVSKGPNNSFSVTLRLGANYYLVRNILKRV